MPNGAQQTYLPQALATAEDGIFTEAGEESWSIGGATGSSETPNALCVILFRCPQRTALPAGVASEMSDIIAPGATLARA